MLSTTVLGLRQYILDNPYDTLGHQVMFDALLDEGVKEKAAQRYTKLCKYKGMRLLGNKIADTYTLMEKDFGKLKRMIRHWIAADIDLPIDTSIVCIEGNAIPYLKEIVAEGTYEQQHRGNLMPQVSAYNDNLGGVSVSAYNDHLGSGHPIDPHYRHSAYATIFVGVDFVIELDNKVKEMNIGDW